jgi:hypothetical protein
MTACINIIAEVIKETSRAWLIDDGAGNEVWLPKSLVEVEDGTGREGENCLFLIPEWLAEEKELT